MFEAEA